MKRVFLLVSLLCGSVGAADFALTLSNYRALIKGRLNVDATNTTFMADSMMNQLIREAVVTVNPVVAGVKVTKQFVTAPERMSYRIDTAVMDIRDVWWENGDTVRPLNRLSVGKWGSLAHQNTWGADDPYLQRPSVYDATDDSIMLYPVPTGYDTIRYIGHEKVTGIATRDTIITIPQKYRVAVLNYATYLVALNKQHPAWKLHKETADSAIARLRD